MAKALRGSSVEIELEILWAEELGAEDLGPPETLEVVLGEGELLPGVEEGLLGVEPGAELVLELSADEAFGAYDPGLIVSLPRTGLEDGDEVAVGDWVPVEIEDEDDPEAEGEELELRVIQVDDDAVFLDANHPLAGRAVRVRVRVLAVR